MRVVLALCLLGWALGVRAQETPSPVPPPGTVIFEREQKPPADSDPQPPAEPAAAEKSGADAPPDADVTVTDEERDALTFTAYDLDLHLTPGSAALEAHVNFVVRNDGKQPLKRLALQLSSTLVWESLRLRGAANTAAGAPSMFVQHRINTDADHTGVAREAVLTLPEPLAPGASLELTAFYTGSIPASAERLERIGAPEEQAEAADWDQIADSGTALRGYGNVLWYPVSAAPVFLGEQAKLFDSVGRARLRQQAATTRLRLTIAYTGEAPDAAYFCGRREPLVTVRENENVPVAESPGVATAEFATRALGFRIPSLFVTDRAATLTDGQLIRAVTDQPAALEQYATAAEKVQPLLMDWLGTSPLGPLELLDLAPTNPAGQPFEDGALLVAPLHVAEVSTLTPVLVHTLAHTWFSSSHAWLEEGVAQFLSLLWVETNDGRQAGIDRLQSAASALALVEPAPGAAATQGQSLIDASSDVYYRTKAAAVLWMLRSIAGDDALKKALQVYRKNHAADASPEGFEKVLEASSGKPAGDLKWFFDDWVYHDRGLPDLSIAYVTPRPLPEKGGKSGGWLVGVNVRNDGDAVAEVPVTVRAGSATGTLTATERLRIPARSNAATRILFQGIPEEVIVNDGTVPESGGSLHVKKIVVKPE